jgi:hypothetical protein
MLHWWEGKIDYPKLTKTKKINKRLMLDRSQRHSVIKFDGSGRRR